MALGGRNCSFRLPTRIEYGIGVSDNISEFALQFGANKALIVVDPFLSSQPWVCKMEEELRLKGLRVVRFERELGEPTDETVHRGVEVQYVERADVFIAIGGGSSIDTAKAIRVVCDHGGAITDYEGVGKVVEPSSIPLIAVPTTAGTGSEVVGCAVVIDTKSRKKIAVLGEYVAPEIAIADPLLTVTLPSHLTAATGFDALAQAIGAYTVTISQPLADAYALYAVELLATNIVRATKQGDDLEAREGMLLGSIAAGIAMGGAECGLDHALAETIAVSHNVPHGLAVAVFLPHVVRFNAQAAPTIFARVARALLPNRCFASEEEASAAAADAIAEIAVELGIPNLQEIGVPENALQELAQDAVKYEEMLRINPRTVDYDDILTLYKYAYRGLLD